jgi:putative DNA-invertase from lambdoid prophage Rac
MSQYAIFARVSTTDKQDPTNQIMEMTDLVRYAESKANGKILEYVEHRSGTGKKDRPIFNQMLRDAEAHKFSILVIWALDRLTREGPLKTMLTIDRLHRAGVKVKSLREPWLDPDSPMYELLLPIFAWIAKQEATRISERVRSKLAQRQAQLKEHGYFIAAKSGKRRTQLGRPRVDVDSGVIVKMREAGRSWQEIQQTIGISRGTAQRAAANYGA